ncbi:SMR family transporter [Variovorax sp.]|uniref:DMT family transporter n=1 Tax=Variovorax sp. TaxID=1871043 RepID=UPI0025CE13C3|nr:SMR family transporter [Variovorax sp.]
MRNFSWLLLAASIAAEVVGTLALRHADGFTRALPSAVVAAAYALWAGAGTALIAVCGVWLFGEAVTLARCLGVAMIVLGVVVLHLDPR